MWRSYFRIFLFDRAWKVCTLIFGYNRIQFVIFADKTPNFHYFRLRNNPGWVLAWPLWFTAIGEQTRCSRTTSFAMVDTVLPGVRPKGSRAGEMLPSAATEGVRSPQGRSSLSRTGGRAGRLGEHILPEIWARPPTQHLQREAGLQTSR